MATLPGTLQMNHEQRARDDLFLLRSKVGEWRHLDTSREEVLMAALRRWPLLAELEGLEPLPDTEAET
ncbi:cellulose biosynthesis BcsR family protein [Marinobacterium marinum]|uniref:Cellulose biosynthesis protein BcsR n=1 Tax=Marinobacterium marinum TaxID=2756129 RepID=A0A7W1WV75_9GAMM|nr:BcsR/BcsP family cellulose biosynthesis protein [Marinobacterium marinum]MBA4500836.1 hypothetical protein [Marinobacterium marinum]